MLNILINAYACSPNWGSEQGMAWNWIINLANYCKLFVITEEEYKDLIDNAVAKLPQRNNIHFYYNPVSEKVRRMCWNQGDWRFYGHYRKWQKSTFRLALKIIDEQKIDVVHQLNMIGFREPGYLWKIKDIPFVWGPIGGMELMSTGYLTGVPLKQKVAVYLKNTINLLQTRFMPRVRKAIARADALVAAVKGVKDKIEKYYGKNVVLINETGCYPRQTIIDEKQNKASFDILWVGKFDFRKQLGLALQTIAKVKDMPDLRFHIIGSGTDKEVASYKKMANDIGIADICIWHGKIPNSEVQNLMQQSDLLLFTSIMEGTPHVVLEAIGNNLPVLCFDACGQSAAVTDSVGVKIPVTNTEQSVKEFADAITQVYNNREMLAGFAKACIPLQQELSWDSKARAMVGIYERVAGKKC
jgi:glycosyltransferase involved in cell wall biosynthesis